MMELREIFEKAKETKILGEIFDTRSDTHKIANKDDGIAHLIDGPKTSDHEELNKSIDEIIADLSDDELYEDPDPVLEDDFSLQEIEANSTSDVYTKVYKDDGKHIDWKKSLENTSGAVTRSKATETAMVNTMAAVATEAPARFGKIFSFAMKMGMKVMTLDEEAEEKCLADFIKQETSECTSNSTSEKVNEPEQKPEPEPSEAEIEPNNGMFLIDNESSDTATAEARNKTIFSVVQGRRKRGKNGNRKPDPGAASTSSHKATKMKIRRSTTTSNQT